MKRSIRIISLLTVLLMVFSLAACTPATPGGEVTTANDTVTESENITSTAVEETTEEPKPEFPKYDGPSSDFKLSCESFITEGSFGDYTGFTIKAEKSYMVPALKEKMVPQGMDIWEERGWLLISGYFSDATYSDSSVIVAVDMESGAYVGEYFLTNEDGTPHTSHAGGIAVTDKNIYVANGYKLYRVPLTEILKVGQCGKVTIAEAIAVPTRASFCNYSGGYLWVGDFQYGKSYPTEEYCHMKNNEGEMYYAWSAGYELTDETESGFKPESLVKDSFATPDVILSITERIQGFAVVGSRIALSQSYGRGNKSTIFLYDDPMDGAPHRTTDLNGKSVPVYFLDSKLSCNKITAPPMSEGLASMNGELYILFESGADKYANGGGKDPTEHVWKMTVN